MRHAFLLPLLAAFFVRQPTTPSGWLRRQGGQCVQEQNITLNGEDGTLAVFAFDVTADALLASLRNASGEANAALPPGIFILPCGAPEAPQCLAFAVEAPTRGEPRWPWPDLPPQGGFEPGFTAVLNDGRTGFASGDSGLPPASARTAWADHLAACGWTAVSPAAESTSLALYARDSEVLALTVLDGANGGCRVSLLRRKPR